MSEIEKSLENTLTDNKLGIKDFLRSGLYVFLILYASLARPNLPNFLNVLFQNNLFKLFIFFLIVYLAQKENDIMMSLLVAIAFFVTMTYLTENTVYENFKERFTQDEKKKNH